MPESPRPPTIDVHVHLVGVGSGASGCHVSPRMRRTVVFKVLRRLLALDPANPRADDIYLEQLDARIAATPQIDRVVGLGMDGVYDAAGRVDLERSHLIVPHDHVFAACRRFARLLPGPSIHPGRADAIERVEECADRGAVLIKWLPPLQLFDPADPAHLDFYRALARRKLPLLAHTGCEHTFPDMIQDYGQPERYRAALDEGATVIFAHCGVACPFHSSQHRLDAVLSMMERYSNLYADDSALCSLLKFHHLKAIPFDRHPGRFVHGSDYPIPALALPFARSLGLLPAVRLTAGRNPFAADHAIKTAVGVPSHVFAATGTLLAERIAIWDRLRTQAA